MLTQTKQIMYVYFIIKATIFIPWRSYTAKPTNQFWAGPNCNVISSEFYKSK